MNLPPATQAPQPFEDVTDPLRVAALLNRLHKHRSLLSVHGVYSPRPHLSMVLAADAGERSLYLDALHPTPVLMPGKGSLLQVRGRLDGGRLRFSCVVSGETVCDGGPALRVELPETITLHEQRATWRLPLPADLPLPPTALRGADGEYSVRLADISPLGAAAWVPAEMAAPLGRELLCKLQLPDAVLTTEAEVRSCTGRGERRRLGLRFAPLRPEQRDRLASAINRLERQLIRSARLRA